MDRLEALQVFSVVAEQTSFVKAARLLGISQTKASRVISELEIDLKTRLFSRTTQHVELTVAGATYLIRCNRALDELRQGDAELNKVRDVRLPPRRRTPRAKRPA